MGICSSRKSSLNERPTLIHTPEPDAAKKKVEEAIGDKLKDAVGGEAGEALKKLFNF